LPQIILGAAWQTTLANDLHALVEMDVNLYSDGKRHTLLSYNILSLDPHIGAELHYYNLIYIRLGAGGFQKIRDIREKNRLSWQPNLGVGIHYKGFTIDYALTDIGNQSVALYSNIFSLRYAFDASSNQKQN